jgi:hypothetical protein
MPPTRKHKKSAATATAATAPAVDMQIEVKYRHARAALTEAEKKQLIRNIKKSIDYYNYLTSKFKFKFEDTSGCTKAIYLWKGGATWGGEAPDRVINTLIGGRATNLNGNLLTILPEGVVSELVKTKKV